MIPYNPFNRQIEELDAENLGLLSDVAEGWYTEYKSEMPTVKNVAKSISSFANHYGGWLFFGINEKDHKAESFPGLECQDLSIKVENIRNAAKDCISPSPYYSYKILEGPCQAIGLAQGKAIIVVAVPSGPNPPYVHSNGRIYRRVADASNPRHETDRFILDELWKRSEKSREKLSIFLSQEPILSKGESEVSYIDIFLMPDPLGAMGIRSSLVFDRFIELMKEPAQTGYGVPFDNFFQSPEGYVCRQVRGNNSYGIVPTWKYNLDGSSIVTLPISFHSLSSNFELDNWLGVYKHKDSFMKLMIESKEDSGYLVDISVLIHAVIAIVAQHKRLMKESNTGTSLYTKAAIHNVWRRIPFLDTKAYIEFIIANGFPRIQFNDSFAPPGKEYHSLILIKEKEIAKKDETPAEVKQAVEAIPLICTILVAFGLCEDEILRDEEFWTCINRARENQEIRLQNADNRL